MQCVDVAYCYTLSHVAKTLSVSLWTAQVSCVKTAIVIEMPFRGTKSWV